MFSPKTDGVGAGLPGLPWAAPSASQDGQTRPYGFLPGPRRFLGTYLGTLGIVGATPEKITRDTCPDRRCWVFDRRVAPTIHESVRSAPSSVAPTYPHSIARTRTRDDAAIETVGAARTGKTTRYLRRAAPTIQSRAVAPTAYSSFRPRSLRRARAKPPQSGRRSSERRCAPTSLPHLPPAAPSATAGRCRAAATS